MAGRNARGSSSKNPTVPGLVQGPMPAGPLPISMSVNLPPGPPGCQRGLKVPGRARRLSRPANAWTRSGRPGASAHATTDGGRLRVLGTRVVPCAMPEQSSDGTQLVAINQVCPSAGLIWQPSRPIAGRKDPLAGVAGRPLAAAPPLPPHRQTGTGSNGATPAQLVARDNPTIAGSVRPSHDSIAHLDRAASTNRRPYARRSNPASSW